MKLIIWPGARVWLARLRRRWRSLWSDSSPRQSPPPGEVFWAGLFVATVAALTLFPCLDHPFVEPDEGRHAEIAREMLASGRWLVPTLQGQPYYNKPPLFYWLIAGSFALFGVTEQAARLVPAMASLFIVLAVYGFGARLLGTRRGMLAGLALCFTTGFVLGGRYLILDSVWTLLLTLSLFSAHEAVRAPGFRWRWWVISAGSCGLAVLTKGPLALVLLAGPVLGFTWLDRRSARPTVLAWGVYLTVVLCLVAPWYAAVMLREPCFGHQFFVDQHLRRFFGEVYHSRPVWFYAPVLLAGCLPWSLLAVPVGRLLLSRPARADRPPALGFFVLWASWVVLFFSFSRGKLPTYVLPALPPIALLLSGYLDRLLFRAVRTEARFPWQAPRPWLGVAVLAGVGIVVCMAQTLIPTFARWRSVRDQMPAVVRMLEGAPAVAASYPQQWNTVAFYLGRESVPTVHMQSGRHVTDFLHEQPRVLLVVPHDADLDVCRRLLPPGRRIVRMMDTRTIRFLLVEADAGC
jgi:4-amino-4-deoxy-L-arabinose transferase-like glycosyltransferase